MVRVCVDSAQGRDHTVISPIFCFPDSYSATVSSLLATHIFLHPPLFFSLPMHLSDLLFGVYCFRHIDYYS